MTIDRDDKAKRGIRDGIHPYLPVFSYFLVTISLHSYLPVDYLILTLG